MVTKIGDNMFVKQVKNFDGYQADLLVTDGRHDLLCYYDIYPPIQSIEIGSKITKISSLFACNVVRAESCEPLIQKDDGFYSYFLRGEVIRKCFPPVIKIYMLFVELDTQLPQDISVGESVEFRVQRLDASF